MLVGSRSAGPLPFRSGPRADEISRPAGHLSASSGDAFVFPSCGTSTTWRPGPPTPVTQDSLVARGPSTRRACRRRRPRRCTGKGPGASARSGRGAGPRRRASSRLAEECSSADTPAPGGWAAWLGWASCCGSPSSTRFRAAPATASTLASDSWPASSTNRVSTLSANSVARPHPGRAGGDVELAVAQRPLQLAGTSSQWPRRAGTGCPRPHAGRSATRPRSRRRARTRVEEVVDDRVRRRGDTDRAALRDEREDLLGAGVGLSGSRGSLDAAGRSGGARDQPYRGLRGRLVLGRRNGRCRRRRAAAAAGAPWPGPRRRRRRARPARRGRGAGPPAASC